MIESKQQHLKIPKERWEKRPSAANTTQSLAPQSRSPVEKARKIGMAERNEQERIMIKEALKKAMRAEIAKEYALF